MKFVDDDDDDDDDEDVSYPDLFVIRRFVPSFSLKRVRVRYFG